ncbi:MAG TPA: glycoside hydrolase family 3 C-terminal domain-containing protein, partial [bacterium]|nr:glycoside hydrolase family 3 C-terminal domain-containing protein [bacterium]
KDLREYYFPAFRMAVVEGGAKSVMGAYNAINGVPCNANRWLMVDVLRKDWGFNGYAVTDCGAPHLMYAKHKYVKTPAEAAAATLNAGVAVECGGDDVIRRNVREAMKQGLVTEATIDTAISQAMTIRMKLGLFDPPEMVPFTKIPESVIGSPAHVEIARQVSRESLVLLKNAPVNGAPLLPLDEKKIKSVAVVGRNAAVLQFGDYSGTPINTPVTPLDGLKNRLGKKVRINHVEWISTPDEKEYVVVPADDLRDGAGKGAARGLKAEYFDNADFSGAPAASRTEAEVNLKADNIPAEAAKGALSARWSGKLVPSKSGAHYFFIDSGGDAKMYVDGKLVFQSAQKKKKKDAAKISGVFDPYYAETAEPIKAATLMLEAGRAYDLKIEYSSAKGVARAKFEWVPPTAANADARAAEMKYIKESDVVIAYIGLQLGDEKETVDRHDLDISNDQTEYVKQLLSLNPNVVVVLINGGPLSINWIAANAPAIVEAWYPGEQGGNAITDVLFGDFSPAGRLPMTYYASVDDLPPFDDYVIEKGRTYMYFEKTPLYPFGFGLSYTTFGYDGLTIDRKSAGPSDTIKVGFNVQNTGARDGDEVVQLYVREIDPQVKRPLKQLRGFKRIHLKKGEKATVELPIAVKDIAFWDDVAKRFKVEPGRYEILVGASSADIRLKDTVSVSGE